MRRLALALAFSLALPSAAVAQGLMGDLHADVNTVQRKLLGLANAIPESAYDWRPAPGVRSIREVFLHVAADNYVIPAMMGKPTPAATGIVAGNQATVAAFEGRALPKAQVVAELEASFAHLHEAMGLTTDANLTEMVKFFGQDWSRQRAMVLTVTHLHEHLGQSIAYARSNNVKPPWSN